MMIISWLQEVRFFVPIVTFLVVRSVIALEFKDVSSDVFSGGHYTGMIAAFGDFNADKRTDLFCIKNGGKTLEVLLSNNSEPHVRKASLSCTFQSIITGVTPGDFNGDSKMDVLVSLQEENSDNVNVVFLWGSQTSIDCTYKIAFNLSVQPFVLDYNDDMIPDVMGSDEDKKRCVWISSVVRNNFTKKFISSNVSLQHIRVPHSSAVADLNGDLVSDVVITGITNVELWTRSKTDFNLENTIDYPKKAVVFGQSIFLDFSTNGRIDHLMPVCYDNICKLSAVVIWDYNNTSWVTLLSNFTYQGILWGFSVHGRTVLEKAALAITLRNGDFNMDGYPDFIVVLENKVKAEETTVVILENVPCVSCPFGRTLVINWKIPGLDSITNIQLVTFYDIFEDGTIDILASNKTGNEWHIHAFKNMDTYDAYFIKVLVLSGLCKSDSNCNPYGANQPGPMIRYNTTKPNGEPLVSCAVQMPQSAHFPLHLPYILFGLGQTPNFVDYLTVAIPEMIDGRIHKREWPHIIPNSQMVVNPYPPAKEHHWINELFLTPSHLVFMTCVALVGTCGFIALIILILHLKEKREDKKEKMQDAYRFHFDAM